MNCTQHFKNLVDLRVFQTQRVKLLPVALRAHHVVQFTVVIRARPSHELLADVDLRAALGVTTSLVVMGYADPQLFVDFGPSDAGR